MPFPPKTCVECGTSYVPRSWTSKMTPICSPECKAKRREARAKVVTLPCVECKTPVECRGINGLTQARRGRAYCSDTCRDIYVARLSSERMAKTNRVHASVRMTRKNPMHDPEAKAKMSATLRVMGWKPPIQGGNGRGPTIPQSRLAEALGWPMEHAIRTGVTKSNPLRLPTSYKVDIANPALKVAIEVDGYSHSATERQAQDRKKDACLRSLGWTVLRFSNQAVMDDLEGCVRTVTSTTLKSKEITITSPGAC